jgi:hypothetical protein
VSRSSHDAFKVRRDAKGVNILKREGMGAKQKTW